MNTRKKNTVYSTGASNPPMADGRVAIDSMTPPARLGVSRSEEDADRGALDDLTVALDHRLGMFYGCDYESQPIYRRQSTAFVDPSVSVVLEGIQALLTPLDDIGEALVKHWSLLVPGTWRDDGAYAPILRSEPDDASHPFISLLRVLSGTLEGDCQDLGFYGTWNFNHWALRSPAPNSSEKVRVTLYLPLALLRTQGDISRWVRFKISQAGSHGTEAAAHQSAAPRTIKPAPAGDDFQPGRYAQRLAEAIHRIRAGEVMSLTLTQGFRRPFLGDAAPVFSKMRRGYPMPEMYFVNLGGGERLMGASPDLQARIVDGVIECAPVCGTLRRGADALEDAALGLELLSSLKEAAALALCTDAFADRLRAICEPGTLKLASRQRIHFFGTVIHAVDHLEGRLAAGKDAWDALLATSAPPTISGVPEQAALRVIEEVEGSQREWFGGAVGYVGVDGNMSVGSIMRLAWFHDEMVELRTGGVIVSHSEPPAEEEESQVKARSLMKLLGVDGHASVPPISFAGSPHRKVHLLTTNDPFANSLIDTLRMSGADVSVGRRPVDNASLVVASIRSGSLPMNCLQDVLESSRPALLIGGAALELLALEGVPTEPLSPPMDGFVLHVRAGAEDALHSMGCFDAGVYCAERVLVANLPPHYAALASADSDVLMAYRHRNKPIVGLLFRPESILSSKGGAGQDAIGLALRALDAWR